MGQPQGGLISPGSLSSFPTSAGCLHNPSDFRRGETGSRMGGGLLLDTSRKLELPAHTWVILGTMPYWIGTVWVSVLSLLDRSSLESEPGLGYLVPVASVIVRKG